MNLHAFEWDYFVSHASEDKVAVAEPLAILLSKTHRVWYDAFSLKLGDSLRRSLEFGLINSNYGIVILSHKFFEKNWTQEELDGLFALGKKLLPIRHNISPEEVARFSPMLAGRFSISTAAGLSDVADKIRNDTALPITQNQYFIKLYPPSVPRGRYIIEIHPTSTTWSTVIVGIPYGEKDNVKLNIQTGSNYSRLVPTSKSPPEQSDDKVWWYMKGYEVISPAKSCYILCDRLPSKLLFGKFDELYVVYTSKL